MSAPVRPRFRAVSDDRDRLIEADEPLAGLQYSCGGDLPGTIAVPALLELVRTVRKAGVRIARWIAAQDDGNAIHAWVEITPREGGSGCDILIHEWQTNPLPADDASIGERLPAELDGVTAELVAWLDARQRLLAVYCEEPGLREAARAMAKGIGRPWTHFLKVDGTASDEPLHWRLLDGALVSVPDSDRTWHARLVPQAQPGDEPSSFELRLVPDGEEAATLKKPVPHETASASSLGRIVGREIAPVLRQPVARIIASAETIRTRLAGPLPEEYVGYAADIAAAAQHLRSLLDDLGDLEIVESDEFVTVPDRIDLAEVSRQAAGILEMRARAKDIEVRLSPAPGAFPATAEFRRVLQILLNLIGNAIRYSPPATTIDIEVASVGDRMQVAVADQGPGLAEADQARVFEKFERLGRSGDGGSGLGLYISRKLARAMGGELSVASEPGRGARFTLELARAA